MNYFRLLFSSTIFIYAISTDAQFKKYTNDSFQEALKTGRPTVVYFHASWCPVCRKQQPILNEIVADKKYEKMVALTADYDTEKEIKTNLKISTQATIVVFKDGKEIARKTGVTQKDELKKLIDSGM